MMKNNLYRVFLAIFLLLCLMNAAQAVVVFRSSASTGQASGGTITVTKPAGTITGDVMLASVTVVTNASTVATPAGWTLVLSTNQTTGNTSRLYTYFKIALAGELASYSWTISGANVGAVAVISSYSGVDISASPIDASAGQATPSSLTHIAPSVTATVAGDMLVTVHEFASARTWTPPAGMTERVDSASQARNKVGVSLELNTELLVAAGATGTRTATAAGNADRGATHSIALKAALLLRHIRIEHDGVASTCAPESITLKACADAACTVLYTSTDVTNVGLSPTGGVYTWTPGTTVSILSAASGINSGITLARSSSGTASLAITGTSTPTPTNAFDCYNTATASTSCSLVFSNNTFSYNIPDHTSIARQVVTLTSCTANFASTTRAVKFWSTYINPVTGTLPAKIVAGSGNADCATGYSSLSTSSVSPTTVNLAFDASPAPQATFSLCYPDVGQVQVDTRYDGSAANSPPDAGVVTLGTDQFIAAPHHFMVSNILCGNGVTYVGCIVTTPYANPAAGSALGAAFMKAGNPFSMTVTAYNSANTVTPNFGKETTPESVTLTPTMFPGLTFTGAVSGVFGTFNNGAASGVAFSFDEVGIMTLTAQLTSPPYLSSVYKEITLPSSVNIGRFTPNHFTLTYDADSPIVTRADFPQRFTNIVIAGVSAPAATIPVDATTGFFVGDYVRIPGAGVGGNAFTATISAISAVPPTLTLNTAISTSLTGGEFIFNEWGSYMGERFDANFTLVANDLAGNVTQNYQGAYAKFAPAAALNPLAFGAVDTIVPTYSLALDTSMPASGVFAAGSAPIIAPLAVIRGATAVGPYTSVKIGIAPTDSDGIKMKSYDLGVASATAVHTSIMDPLVQDVTAVRYGRMKISNAHGSEQLSLPLPLTAQYWNATDYVTNTQDNITLLSVAGLVPGNYQRKSGDTWTTSVTLPNGMASAGAWAATLSRPTVTFTGRGSVDIQVTAPTYLPGTGHVTFGIYKGASEFIYLRENY